MVEINKGRLFYGLNYHYDGIKQDHIFKISYHLITNVIEEEGEQRVLCISCKGEHFLTPEKREVPMGVPNPWLPSPNASGPWHVDWNGQKIAHKEEDDYSWKMWTGQGYTPNAPNNTLSVGVTPHTINVPNMNGNTYPSHNHGYSADITSFSAPEITYQIYEGEFLAHFGYILFTNKEDLIRKIQILSERKIFKQVDLEAEAIKKEYLRKKLAPKGQKE
jgi:hypothetical protein